MQDILSGLASDNGILGIMLALSFGAIFFLYKENKESKKDRLTDMKEVWQEDVKFRAELKILIQNILDILRGKK